MKEGTFIIENDNQQEQEKYMTKNMFITDFDGVLCDSVQECLLVTHNACQRLRSAAFRRCLDVSAIESATQQTFRSLRAYLKGAEDFVPMLLAIKQNISINSQAEFTAFRTQHEEHLPEYTQAFYAERDYLKQHETELWLKLNPLFDGLAETLKQRSSFDRFHILTTKRQDDVLKTFQYQEIHFPAEQITYMKAVGKSQKLIEILQEQHALFEESVYFEDQVDFLVESSKQQIGSYLIEWGYVSEEQKQLARHHQIPIITIRQYQEMIRNF